MFRVCWVVSGPRLQAAHKTRAHSTGSIRLCQIRCSEWEAGQGKNDPGLFGQIKKFVGGLWRWLFSLSAVFGGGRRCQNTSAGRTDWKPRQTPLAAVTGPVGRLPIPAACRRPRCPVSSQWQYTGLPVSSSAHCLLLITPSPKDDHCLAKADDGNCSLEKWAVTAVCLCTARRSSAADPSFPILFVPVLFAHFFPISPHSSSPWDIYFLRIHIQPWYQQIWWFPSALSLFLWQITHYRHLCDGTNDRNWWRICFVSFQPDHITPLEHEMLPLSRLCHDHGYPMVIIKY